MKKVCIVCLALLILTGCTGTQNIHGFNNELLTMLQNSYELTLPDSAVFHKGYYDNAFQDDGIYLLFSVPEDEFDTLLSSGWAITEQQCNDQALTALLAKPIDRLFVYQQEMYTYMICSAPENGLIVCAFHGRHPTDVIVS